jgi:hypothetical protein
MNAVLGTIFTANFPVFTGSRTKPKWHKNIKIVARISIDACYAKDNKHWIYFTVLESEDVEFFAVGKQYKKQGKNFYPAILCYTYPENYAEIAETKAFKKQIHFGV